MLEEESSIDEKLVKPVNATGSGTGMLEKEGSIDKKRSATSLWSFRGRLAAFTNAAAIIRRTFGRRPRIRLQVDSTAEFASDSKFDSSTDSRSDASSCPLIRGCMYISSVGRLRITHS